MENQKATFMANIEPDPWQLSKSDPPKPRNLRLASPGDPKIGTGMAMPGDTPLTSDQQGPESNSPMNAARKTRLYQRSQSNPSGSPDSTQVSPLVPDQMFFDWGVPNGSNRDLYESRTRNVAAAAAAGKSRWGVMENARASFASGTMSMSPDAFMWSDTGSALNSIDTGLSMPGSKPVTNDQTDYVTRRTASVNNTLSSTPSLQNMSSASGGFTSSRQPMSSNEGTTQDPPALSSDWRDLSSDWMKRGEQDD